MIEVCTLLTWCMCASSKKSKKSQLLVLTILFFFQNYETHLMKRDSSHCGSGDPLAPFGNALKSFFVFKLFLILSFLISLVTLAVTLINAIQQNRCEIFSFFSSHSLKNERKNISFSQFVYFLREVCLLFNF